MNESRPLEMVDNVANRWAAIVVPFYVKDPNSAHKALGCGSGFIVERHRATFLVTAHHVLQNLRDGEALIANIGGKSVLLNGLPFITAPEDDVAVAIIDPTWAQKQRLTRVFPLSLDTQSDAWAMLDIFILLGYPGSQNKLNWNTNETTRRLVAYSSSQRIEQPRCITHIRDPVAFDFDKKAAINTDKGRTNVGPFNGNSGGPVLEIRGRREQDDTMTISASLAGVFIGWDKNHKELVCCRPNVIVGLIDGLVL